MESNHKVNSAVPVAPYLGGKRNLAKRLVQRIEAVPHRTYAEPFVGMGGVFLRRADSAKAEVINDFNREVSNFFGVLQVHYVPFLEMMRFQITSRAEFVRLTETDPDTLTDMMRAARFLYLQRTAFGGKISGQAFGVSVDRGARFDVNKLGPMLDDLHSRLSGVTIECLPYQAFIERYDRKGTLFYLDPPYYGNERDYGKSLFNRGDFHLLAGQLAKIKGRFLLSLNDVPAVREIFSAFDIEGVQTTYSVGNRGSHTNKAKEVIISN